MSDLGPETMSSAIYVRRLLVNRRSLESNCLRSDIVGSRVTPSAQLARRLVIQFTCWCLISLFGPAPITALFVSQSEQECEMACCRRLHGRYVCHRASSSTAGYSLSASDACVRSCCGALAAPDADALIVTLPTSIEIPRTRDHGVASLSERAMVFSIHPFLYQRPPPILNDPCPHERG